jgi:hypothetical protein
LEASLLSWQGWWWRHNLLPGTCRWVASGRQVVVPSWRPLPSRSGSHAGTTSWMVETARCTSRRTLTRTP